MPVKTTLSIQLTRKADKNVYVDVENDDGQVTNTLELHANQIQQVHIGPGELLSVYVDDAPHQEPEGDNNEENTDQQQTDQNAESK